MMKIAFSDDEHMYNTEVAGRRIDGHDGAIGSGTLKEVGSGQEVDNYLVSYYPSSTTKVTIISSYPWEEGTLQLLKTIHIEEAARGGN